MCGECGQCEVCGYTGRVKCVGNVDSVKCVTCGVYWECEVCAFVITQIESDYYLERVAVTQIVVMGIMFKRLKFFCG